ncbi:response regulator [Gelidibacter pelagius]|uniref:Response regulator n=1 Tax=Gelidibacter pelagius TaxID=2819985 RepID=A0ABS3SVF9_9FLAO|nr:response regulator [Gelidibacter pelagius]MBO3099699.1 response regulator [Gelidibacter pelagius]
MKNTKLHLLLADDDIDDCDFFRDAIDEISDTFELTVLNNGVELMSFLVTEPETHPNLIFLDLNMPKKSGMECIAEIKASDSLSHIPIIIYSTSLDHIVVNTLYDMGAHHYIQKPAEFTSIKSVIKKVISLFDQTLLQPRSRDNFIIQP